MDVKERQKDRQTYKEKEVEIDIQTDRQTYQDLCFFISFVLQSMKPFYFVYLTFRREGCALSMDFLFILLLSDTVSRGKKEKE